MKAKNSNQLRQIGIILNNSKVRQLLSIFLTLVINFLFAYKYCSRSTNHPLLLSLFYIALLAIIFFLFKRLNFKFLESNWLYYSYLFLYSLSYVVAFHFIQVESLNVDRWSVISSFWNEAFKGHYPYNAQSHMGNYPAPLPFYFVLALPFHLLGEIGYFSVWGVIIFAALQRKFLTRKQSLGTLVILSLSVSIFWEISVRSTIFVNTVLFMAYLFWLVRVDLNRSKQFWASAIIGGLLLSTRTIFAIPIIIYCIFLFKEKEILFKQLVTWILCVCVIFSLTFFPFFLFYLKEFLNRNPFLIQTDAILPFQKSVIFLILAIVAGYKCSHKFEIPYYTVAIFVLMVIAYFTLECQKFGIMIAYSNSYIDLSYLLFTFPFLLLFSNSTTGKLIE